MIKALIAVRSGSTRVVNKNMRPFAGSSLLEIKIRQLKRISLLDGIVVNSNDPSMLELAASLGCEAVQRDPYYASNTVSMSDVYRNMAENMDCDTIVYANATNPLLKDETLYKAIETYQQNKGKHDSLNSAHYDLRHQPRSQDLPDIAALNFAINILERQTMIECKNVVGYCPLIYTIDEVEATDIDNPLDFEFAEFVYKKGL